MIGTEKPNVWTCCWGLPHWHDIQLSYGGRGLTSPLPNAMMHFGLSSCHDLSVSFVVVRSRAFLTLQDVVDFSAAPVH